MAVARVRVRDYSETLDMVQITLRSCSVDWRSGLSVP